MASTKGLVPITRSFLASYYDTKPFPPLSDDVSLLSSQIRSLSSDLLSHLPPNKGEAELVKQADGADPHKVDENMWRNREYMEEIVFLLERSRWPSALQRQSNPEVDAVLDRLRQKIQRTLNSLVSFQATNSERVFSTVMTYLPQDFRGTLIRQQRERSERNKQAEVDAVVSSGGSIHDKHALLWGQQMDRRRQLAQLGSATGVYKTLVKYLVGVPEVLLDFVRQINDDDGPMEEQRSRYGPHAYRLTSMVLKIRLFIELSWRRFHTKELEKEELAILEKAVDVYTSEFERFISFISDVFANSPFFISAEEAGTIEGWKTDDFKEISIPAGKTHEISVTVDTLNSYIAWDFSLVQGKMKNSQDIGFSVDCTSLSGEKTSILPYLRYESDQATRHPPKLHSSPALYRWNRLDMLSPLWYLLSDFEGSFCTCVTGKYKLIWDNSYSSFFKKVLRYKVDCIPPVVEPLQSSA